MSFYKKYEKEILFAAVALTFFILYPLINMFSEGRPAHILYTYYDGILPFVPIFIIPYISGFFMPMLLYFFVKDIKFFRKAVIAYFVMLVMSYVVYLVYPVKVILRPETYSGFFAPIFQLYIPIDPPYNAFPSLHVAQPVLAGMLVYHYNKKYWWMLLWAAIIALSTFFVKQHYLADIGLGILFAVSAYILFVKMNTKSRK